MTLQLGASVDDPHQAIECSELGHVVDNRRSIRHGDDVAVVDLHPVGAHLSEGDSDHLVQAV